MHNGDDGTGHQRTTARMWPALLLAAGILLVLAVGMGMALYA